MPPTADDLAPLARQPWDVVVVGAGPAGSLAAHGCASRGLRVLLVEQRRFPRWKVCGACLSPQALAALDAAGLEHLVEEQGGLPLQQLQLGVAGRVSPIALARGQALSRARFDQALLEEAESAGATVLEGTRAALGANEAGAREVVLRQGAGRQSVRARVVLIAAGLAHRCLDDEPGLHTQIESGSRVGAGCVLPAEAAAVPPGVLQMAVGRGGYVGLVRVESGEINLACALDRDQLRASGGAGPACQQLLMEAGFPPLPELPEGSWQLTPPLSRRTRPLAGHRLLLLGDAAGYVEPFTGEGMGWALTSALAALPLVSRGLEHWDGVIEADWRRRHQQWVERRQGFCRGLALLLRHPWATRSLHRGAARLPALTSSMIEVLQRPALPSPIN